MNNSINGGFSAARRSFAKLLVATVLAGGVVSSSHVAFAADGPSGSITVMAYGGVFEQNYRKVVLEPFMKAYPNIKVNYYVTGSSANMLGVVRAQKNDPQVDVVIFDASTSLIGDQEGVLSKLSATDIPNMADLSPQATIREGYGPAVTFDNLAFPYNPAAFDKAPTSVSVLWDKKLSGRVAIAAMPNIQGAGLTAVVAKSIGEDYTKSIRKTVDKLAELAPHVQTFDPKPDGYTMVLNGDVDIATGWNSKAQVYHKQSEGKLDVMLPKEGSVLQINTINLVKGAPNPEAAKVFINYALSPEIQAAVTNAMFYAPVNPKAKISDEARDATVAGKLDKMLPFDWSWQAKVSAQWNQAWRRRIISAQ